MSALTANKANVITNPQPAYIEFPVKGSVHIYQGAKVCVATTDGYARPAADTANFVWVGTALVEVNNTGADGAAIVQVQPPDDFETITILSTATQATVGNYVYLKDDQSVDVAGGSSNKVAYGQVFKFLTASSVLVNTKARFAKSST